MIFICSHLSFVFFSPWTNFVGPPRREDGEQDFFLLQLFSLVICFLDLGPILDLAERSVRGICFYWLAKKSAVAPLLQITSVYRCLNNFLVRKISCEYQLWEDSFIFSLWCICVSEWISSWETHWRPVNFKPKLFFLKVAKVQAIKLLYWSPGCHLILICSLWKHT